MRDPDRGRPRLRALRWPPVPQGARLANRDDECPMTGQSESGAGPTLSSWAGRPSTTTGAQGRSAILTDPEVSQDDEHDHHDSDDVEHVVFLLSAASP